MPVWRVAVLETALWAATRRVRRRAVARGISYQRLSMRPDGHELRKLGTLIDAGALEVIIDSTFGFDQAAEAFARVETRHAKGKVIVEVTTVGG
jgi:alcohol dehydrogenase